MTEQSRKNFDLFVSCAPGLEALLQEELVYLGFPEALAAYRGVYVPYEDLFEAVFRVNYCSRLATRVLLPLAKFRCQGRHDLYRMASEIHWENYIPSDKTIAIDANVSHPALRNSLYAAQVMKDAICDRLREQRGERPSVDVANPDVQLNLFIHDSAATISFDTSCTALHKRGYRQSGGDAPLQEVLAAAVLWMAQWHGQTPLCDLCCGTGTFLTEAALIATNTAPGFLRQRWGFTNIPGYTSAAWLKFKREVDEMRLPLAPGLITGVDIDPEAIDASYANLRACGFSREVSLHQGDFADFVPASAPGLVVSNPPHGGRLGRAAPLEPLYKAIGGWIREHSARPSSAYVLLSQAELIEAIGLKASKRHKFISGGETKYLCEYQQRPRISC